MQTLREGEKMTTKHEIEIPDLPGGWRVVAYRVPLFDEYIFTCGKISLINAVGMFTTRCLIVEKIKPRRIVLEETDRDRDHMKDEMITIDDRTCVEVYGDKIWRIVEEE